MYTISLCIYADSRMIGPPRTPALGYEFLKKKLNRGSRGMDAVAGKSDAVTAWKCTATDAYRRLQTLTDAYRRWFPVRGFCSFCVWPCQSVPQCDWAFSDVDSTSQQHIVPSGLVVSNVLFSNQSFNFGCYVYKSYLMVRVQIILLWRFYYIRDNNVLSLAGLYLPMTGCSQGLLLAYVFGKVPRKVWSFPWLTAMTIRSNIIGLCITWTDERPNERSST